MIAQRLPSGQSRPVESVQRALQVLRLFIDADPDAGLSVTETAQALGVANSTISRLMATLASEGFVKADPVTRRYHIGAMAFQVGSRFDAAALARTMKPYVRELATDTGHTAQLGTLHESRVLYLSVAEAANRLRVVASPGDSRLAHASAMGKVLLASLPHHEQEAVISTLLDADGLLPATGPGTITDPVLLREELATIRTRGFSTSREEATADVAAVGVLVETVTDVPLALSIAFPSSQLGAADQRLQIQQLRRVAARVADAMSIGRGHPPAASPTGG